MTRQRARLYNRGLGYLLFFVGASMSVWFGTAVVRGIATADWPESSALIYQADIVETTQTGDQVLVAAELNYRYQFAGQSYSGENLYRTSIPFNSERNMKEQLAQFSVGAIAPVFVNPEYPSEAILIRGTQPALFAGLVFAVICFAIGLNSVRKPRNPNGPLAINKTNANSVQK